MLDSILMGASCATGALTALPVVGDDSDVVKSLSNPELKMIGCAGITNNQYIQITSPRIPLPGIVVSRGLPPTYHTRSKMFSEDILTAYGYQDSGGAAEYVYALLGISYGARRSLPQGRVTRQRVAITDGNVAWGNAGAFTQLDRTKNYAIKSVKGIGASCIAARFISPTFNGLRPGLLMQGCTDVGLVTEQSFPVDDVPVFSGKDGCTVQGWGAGAANIIEVELIEF